MKTIRSTSRRSHLGAVLSCAIFGLLAGAKLVTVAIALLFIVALLGTAAGPFPGHTIPHGLALVCALLLTYLQGYAKRSFVPDSVSISSFLMVISLGSSLVESVLIYSIFAFRSINSVSQLPELNPATSLVVVLITIGSLLLTHFSERVLAVSYKDPEHGIGHLSFLVYTMGFLVGFQIARAFWL